MANNNQQNTQDNRRKSSDELLDGQASGGQSAPEDNIESFLDEKGHATSGSFVPSNESGASADRRQQTQTQGKRPPGPPEGEDPPNPFTGQTQGRQEASDNKKTATKAHDPKMQDRDPEREMREAEEKLEEVENTSEEQYLQRLEEHDVDPEEAERIIDHVIFQNGPYFETVNVYKDVDVTFRTRNISDRERVGMNIERLGPQYQQNISLAQAKGNLATSLIRYDDRIFATWNEDQERYEKTSDDIEETRKWIEKIDERLFTVLARKLNEFDQKIGIIFSEGYIDVF